MASTAGELRDIAIAFEHVDSALDADRAAIAELQRKHALIADSQKLIMAQIDIFREGINEQFRRLREGIK